jgi:hypothetical protein
MDLSHVEARLLKTPLMMAISREAYAAQLALLLDLQGKFGIKLYHEVFPRTGSAVEMESMRADVTEEWCKTVGEVYLRLKEGK